MSYFNNDFIQFFKDLSQNNNKEWFHANKKRYESQVKKPFEQFLEDLISEMQQYDAALQIAPKDCVLRINRDLRFSKDKTPYNLHYSAVVSTAGRKDKSIPGLFLRFTPEEVGIMGGAYVLDTQQLKKVRKHLVAHHDEFDTLLKEGSFATKFGALQGEESKRLPPEFQEAGDKVPLIRKKQFYYVARRKTDLITDENLLTEILDYWHAARPVNEFLTQITRS